MLYLFSFISGILWFPIFVLLRPIGYSGTCLISTYLSFPVFLYCWFLISFHCSHKAYFVLFEACEILFYDQKYVLSWRPFYVDLRKMDILLLARVSAFLCFHHDISQIDRGIDGYNNFLQFKCYTSWNCKLTCLQKDLSSAHSFNNKWQN